MVPEIIKGFYSAIDIVVLLIFIFPSSFNKNVSFIIVCKRVVFPLPTFPIKATFSLPRSNLKLILFKSAIGYFSPWVGLHTALTFLNSRYGLFYPKIV